MNQLLRACGSLQSVPKWSVPFLVLVLVSSASADVVYDRAGGTLKGLVVEEHHDRIVVSTEEGEKTIHRNQIEEVFYADLERNYLYLGSQVLEEKDFTGAIGFFRKALQINPGLTEAEDAIHRAEDWMRKGGILLLTADTRQELKDHWGFVLQPTPRLASVAEVESNSLAQEAGILVDDGLVSVWSSSLAFLGLEEIARELLGPAGSRVKLTVERQVQLSGSAGIPSSGPWPGIKLSMKHLGLTLLELETDASAAVHAALQAGDRIIAIDGKSTRYMPLGNAHRLIQEARQHRVTLVIHRDLMIQRR